jgi:hypothetical protein
MEWPVILALVIAIPTVLLVPVVVWGGGSESGLYQVICDAVRSRAWLAEEPAVRR